MIWLILGVALCLYLPFLSAPFLYDDFHSLVWNPALKSWDSFGRIWVDPGLFSNDPARAMYRPLLLCSYLLSGLLGHTPEDYRLGNLLLHLQAGGMVYLLGQWLTGRRAAKWAAALFLLHPAFSEPFFYISSRSESLMTVYACTALWMYVRDWRLGAFVCAVLAILSKETAVVLLPLLMWYDWMLGNGFRVEYDGGIGEKEVRWLPRLSQHVSIWFHAIRAAVGLAPSDYSCIANWSAKKMLFRYAPFAALTAGYLWLSWQWGLLAGAGTRAGRPWADHFWTQAAALRDYTLALVWPVHWGLEGVAVEQHGPSWLAATSLFFVVVSALWAWQHENRTVKFLWGAFWLAFLPTLILPLNILMAERRLYWPGVFLCIGAGMLASKFERQAGRVGIALFLVGLGAFATLTYQRGRVWENPEKLWAQTAAAAPDSYRAMMNYGTEAAQAGHYAEARASLEKALTLAADSTQAAMALGNLASLYFTQGELDSSFSCYVQAIHYDSLDANLWANLGVLWFETGKKRTGDDRGVRWQGAEAYLKHALRLQPNHRQAHLGLFNLYHAVGLKDLAEVERRLLEGALDNQVLIPYTGGE